MTETPNDTKKVKQITMYVPVEVLDKVDEAAYQMRQRRNDRTTWIINAINEKLATVPDDARITEIVTAYESMNDTGKDWLHKAAGIASAHDEFK